MGKRKSVLQQYDELIALRPSFGKRRVQLTVAQCTEYRIRMEQVLAQGPALFAMMLDRILKQEAAYAKKKGIE